MVAAACGGNDAPTLTDATVPLTDTVGDLDDAAISASGPLTDTVGDIVDLATATVGDVSDALVPPNPNDLLTSADAYVVRVIERRGHDPDAYTQGLEFFGARLFESRGIRGESAVTEIDPLTGQVIRAVGITDEFFAEGITRVDDRLVTLTWEAERAFVLDLETFEQVAEFGYSGEGWGICHDGESLWMSNGSSILAERDPVSFEVLGEMEVAFEGTPVFNLNELECIDGLVWANVWKTNMIVVIDPVTAEVVARIDASALEAELGSFDDGDALLNGIAYDKAANRVLLTGKYWPMMFMVELEPCTGDCAMPPLVPVDE